MCVRVRRHTARRIRHNMMGATALRDAAWLTGARTRQWIRPFAIALFGCVASAAVMILVASVGQKPPASDFDPFWVAGRFVLQGHAASAYDIAAVDQAERAATDMPAGYLPFYYPPPFLLFCAPLGLFGFTVALLLFVVGETALIVACLRQVLPRNWGWLPLVTFPGFLVNAICGQNAALSAACFAGAAIWLEERPILAGFCLSGLVCKPQLAICLPVWLLLTRRFRCLVACGGGAVVLCAVSWLLVGSAAWHGFLAHGADAGYNIRHIAMIWPKLQSLFGAVLLLGGTVAAAAFVQAAFSLAALIWVMHLSLSRRGALIEVAVVTTASLMVTPYLLDYDLAILAVPMACLVRLAQDSGWQPYEKTLLLALFLLPLVARVSGLMLGITLGPAFIVALMVVLGKRAHAWSGPTA